MRLITERKQQMSQFQGITTGNIAVTPIKPSSSNMSPTEVAAFTAVLPDKDAGADTTLEESTGFRWVVLAEETWVEPKLGESISNSFRRTTRKADIAGGTLYATSTCGICYVRGTANTNTSETLVFVADSGQPTVTTKVKK